MAAGFTLEDEIYIKPGELMCRVADELPLIGSHIRANIFWMGKSPMIPNKKYKIKLTTSHVSVHLVEIINVLDASDLSSTPHKDRIERHDVAEVVLETTKPIAFDLSQELEATGRFVIVDNYEISGGGIIIGSASDESSTVADHVRQREMDWDRSEITPEAREYKYRHKSRFIAITGNSEDINAALAKALEKKLFERDYYVYYLGASNIDRGLDSDVIDINEQKEERIRRLGELARILTDSGQIFITSISGMDRYDLEQLKLLNAPNEVLVVSAGENSLDDYPVDVSLTLDITIDSMVSEIISHLKQEDIIPDYII
jgi:bifunctional enzyme CysN/CysC